MSYWTLVIGFLCGVAFHFTFYGAKPSPGRPVACYSLNEVLSKVDVAWQRGYDAATETSGLMPCDPDTQEYCDGDGGR